MTRTSNVSMLDFLKWYSPFIPVGKRICNCGCPRIFGDDIPGSVLRSPCSDCPLPSSSFYCKRKNPSSIRRRRRLQKRFCFSNLANSKCTWIKTSRNFIAKGDPRISHIFTDCDQQRTNWSHVMTSSHVWALEWKASMQLYASVLKWDILGNK